jgi:hypothetical protein
MGEPGSTPQNPEPDISLRDNGKIIEAENELKLVAAGQTPNIATCTLPFVSR